MPDLGVELLNQKEAWSWFSDGPPGLSDTAGRPSSNARGLGPWALGGTQVACLQGSGLFRPLGLPSAPEDARF
jgi:hypothetical protein